MLCPSNIQLLSIVIAKFKPHFVDSAVIIIIIGWTFVVSTALYARELLGEPLDITL